MSRDKGNFYIFNDITQVETVLIYKHFLSYAQIQDMSYFDFQLYSKLILNLDKEVTQAQNKAIQDAQK